MKKVVFQDVVTGQSFLVDSVVETAETVVWTDGKSYPVVKIEISDATDPEVDALPPQEMIEITYTKRDMLH